MKTLLFRAAIAMAAAGVVAATLWSVETLALGPIRSADRAIGDLHARLTDLRTRTEAAMFDLARIEAEGSAASQPRLFIENASAAVSSATVQEQLRSMIASAGGVLLSSLASVEDIEDGMARIRVILRARLSEDGILGLLEQFERTSPRIAVAGLEIRPTSVDDGQPPLELAGVLVAFHLDAP